MLTADVLRAVALLSVAAGALTGWVSIVYTAVAAFLVGTLSVLFNVADTAALRFLVPAPQGSSAVVQLQARENAAWLVGGPLGGFLFGLGRALPFLFDGVSYLIGVVTTLLIRRQFQGDRAEQSRGVFREMWHGLPFVLRQPYLHAVVLLAAAGNGVTQAMILIMIFVAEGAHASSAEIGLMLACAGLGGLVG